MVEKWVLAPFRDRTAREWVQPLVGATLVLLVIYDQVPNRFVAGVVMLTGYALIGHAALIRQRRRTSVSGVDELQR